MKQIQSFGLLIFVGIMWWGLVYPELCFMEGTYEVAAVTAADTISGYMLPEDLENLNELEGLFEAGPEKIIVKSEIMRKWIQ